MCGHKLYYSDLENLGDLVYVRRIADPEGRDGGGDGIICHNVVAFCTGIFPVVLTFLWG